MRNHPDEDVRFGVAFALGGAESEDAIDALLALSGDRSDDVRNWATFGLARQIEADTPSIREALAARLEDPDEEVRYEAVLGLARRRDVRMTAIVKTLLHEEPGDIFAREAAACLLGIEYRQDIGTADLLGALQRQQRWAGRRP